MHIVSRKMLRLFAAAHPDAATALEAWYRLVRQARWHNSAELRKDYPSADQVGSFTVFNIRGNKYRLIAVVMFEAGRVYVRSVLTHKDYDRGRWKADVPKRRRPRKPRNREDS